MQSFDWISLSAKERQDALARPDAMSDPALIANVATIMAAVKDGGDKAILDYTAKFDGVSLDSLRVDMAACKACLLYTSPSPRDRG